MPVANGWGVARPLAARAAGGRGALGGLLDDGLIQEGAPPPPEAVSALAGYGLDISWHRSQRVTAADLRTADLVLGMSRGHVRHAVVIAPEIWPRAFTLKELIRRGTETGPRRPGRAAGRTGWPGCTRAGNAWRLLGDSPADDVADPMGGPPQAYADTAALLNELMGRLAGLCWGLPADRLPRAAVTPRRRSSSHPRTWPAPRAPHPDRPSGPGS